MLGAEVDPSVRLSPKARKVVAVSRGGAVTWTAKPHDARAPRASAAVHVTVVDPIGNAAPEAGAHATVTGCAPPLVCGASNETATGRPSGDCRATAAGHRIVGPVGAGPIGESPQPAATLTSASRNSRRKETYMNRRAACRGSAAAASTAGVSSTSRRT
jgi:hypothetical protein